MKVNVEQPEIMRIAYHQEAGDPDHGSCLWAYFDFDTEKWMLNIQSDCGNYAYRWPQGKTETFLELCARMNGDYLLNKFCRKTQVDTDLTVEKAREYLQDTELDQMKIQSAIEELELLFDDVNCEESIPMAQYILDGWNYDNNLEIDEAYSLAVTAYTLDQMKIIRVFEENIQPKIREILKAKAADGNAGGELHFSE